MLLMKMIGKLGQLHGELCTLCAQPWHLIFACTLSCPPQPCTHQLRFRRRHDSLKLPQVRILVSLLHRQPLCTAPLRLHRWSRSVRCGWGCGSGWRAAALHCRLLRSHCAVAGSSRRHPCHLPPLHCTDAAPIVGAAACGAVRHAGGMPAVQPSLLCTLLSRQLSLHPLRPNPRQLQSLAEGGNRVAGRVDSLR